MEKNENTKLVVYLLNSPNSLTYFDLSEGKRAVEQYNLALAMKKNVYIGRINLNTKLVIDLTPEEIQELSKE